MYSPRIELEPTIFLNGRWLWLLVIIVLLAAFGLARRRPDYGLGLVLAATPLYQIRGQIGLPAEILAQAGVPTTFLELLLIAVLLAVLSRWPDIRPRRSPYDPWLALWVGGGLLAALAGPDLREGLGLWRAFFLEPALFFYAALAVFRNSDLKPLLWGALGAVAGLALWTGYLLLDGRALAYDNRLLGPFQSPNYLVLLLSPLLLWLLTWPKRELLTVRAVVGSAGVAMLVAANSRGGQLALLAGLLVGTAFLKGKLRQWALLAVAGLLIAGAALLGPRLLQHSESQVISARPVIWQETLGIIGENPLFGNGPGQFQDVFRQRIRGNQDYELYVLPQALNSHNIVLVTWAEWGLLTLLGLLGLLVAFGRTVWRRFSYWQIVPVTMMTAIVLHGLVDTPIQKNDLAIVFVTVLALSLLVPKVPARRIG